MGTLFVEELRGIFLTDAVNSRRVVEFLH